ncbi:HalOD1 output domain-containing protein [Haladaptatus sp. DFWS20]|uniref:HalOD1 output domain-containing protein n=1 Tax=Haladaptatus sp. DFWS20 TaxID=3403467 RepID=UPI003EBA8E1D
MYGTARDSVVVMLARALGTVLDTHPTKLRPALYDVVDIDALQRLTEREETSVYATFNYEEYEVVVDGGEIRLYESR